MTKLDCRGLWVALATPFTEKGDIDLAGFRRLVQHVAKGGADTLVVLGSTGEAATIEPKERTMLIEATLEEARGANVVVGTGSNSTKVTCEQTSRAQELGAHGALVVTPFYNKPMPDGVVEHFRATCGAAPGFPIVAYNVPGRTGSNLAPSTLARLWELPQVVAVKESSGNVMQIGEVARTLPKGKALLAGDDSLALASIAVGAIGLVSVVGNVAPKQTKELVEFALAGDREGAVRANNALLPLIDALFVESNPIPVKAALHLLGIGGDAMRLPLTRPTAATKKAVEAALRPFGLLAEQR
ncbi:MAG: 4-hydroxy-tetrahydrodipicolinate synthase [Planctomycetota bacterium]